MTGEPVTPGTRFSAGSLAKSMVATVIADLAEMGRLSLDDPVAAHAPELRVSGWAGRATVRDLLTNRSGLPLRAGLEFGFDDRTDQDGRALLVGRGRRATAIRHDWWCHGWWGRCCGGRCRVL
jgi:CubicO group peptidase (beta-lactamase class C family)